MLLDWTFSTKRTHNGKKVKGTYLRRIEDIQIALDWYGADQLSAAAKFVAYYWACEKLARAIIGIADKKPAGEIFLEDKPAPKSVTPNLARVREKLGKLEIPFDEARLKLLFEPQENVQKPTSAKRIRDRLFHDLDRRKLTTPQKMSRRFFRLCSIFCVFGAL